LIFVFILNKKGILERHHISLWGPALLVRTKKGRTFLKRIAQKTRFWKAFGNLGIVFCFIMMILMTTLLIWQAWFISGFTPEQKEAIPGPEVALVLPGINPILPLEYIGYIILALIIAVIVHEFSHGILTFASKLKVKSLGLLYLVVPLGAFCEPDEKQLQKTKHSNRMRIFAAGPTMNFVVVLICILLFSFVLMQAVQPTAEGTGVFSVGQSTPAEKIGLTPGMIITEINDTKISDTEEFFNAMKKTKSNQTMNITYVQGEKSFAKQVTLADRSNYTRNDSHLGQGYLGVGPSDAHKGFLALLKNPFISFPDGFLLFYMLPLWGYFQGYTPIVAPFTDAYTITGPLSIIPSNLFWIIINAIYWILWLNFALAIFNVLPAIPLDGGYLLKDTLDLSIKRIKKDLSQEKQEKLVGKISLILSLGILILIILPWLIKYI
jgi:membrane-associated protease RseP (regulator of RpoE activity)